MWLRPDLPASPTSRITSSSGAAVGSGRFGSAASTSPRRCSTVRNSSSSSFSRAETPFTSAIASDASSPLRWSSPIRLLAWFFRARRSSSSGKSERRRSSSSSASSKIAGSIPRRASPSRAGCWSSRICLRSSIATPSVVLAAAARVLGEEVRDGLGFLAGHDVGRHDRAREAAVADREQSVVAIHLADVEVRPVRALAALELSLGLRPVRVRLLERVAAGAPLVEELGSAMGGLVALGHLDLAAATGEQSGEENTGDG